MVRLPNISTVKFCIMNTLIARILPDIRQYSMANLLRTMSAVYSSMQCITMRVPISNDRCGCSILLHHQLNEIIMIISVYNTHKRTEKALVLNHTTK